MIRLVKVLNDIFGCDDKISFECELDQIFGIWKNSIKFHVKTHLKKLCAHDFEGE